MKIAFVVDIFPKLSETFILSQITGLMDLGHEVDVFACRQSNEAKIHQDIIRYNLLSKVTYFDGIPQKKLRRKAKAIKIVLRYFLFFPKEIIECLDYKRYGGKYSAVNNLFKLAPFLKKRYDVIHCHFGVNGLRFLFLKGILGEKVKYVTSFHGYDVTKYIKKHGVRCYENLYLKGDLFIANSRYTKSLLKNNGCDESKIIKLPVGLCVEKFKFNQKKFNGKINILTIARLVEKKGLEYSIKGVAKIIEKYPHLELSYKIAGDGLLREKLKKMILKLNLEKRVKLLGWSNENEIRRLFNEAHIFILTSVTAEDGDTEGQGLVLQEAQASGLPVIATNHNGFPDSIIDGRSGFLVAERNIDAIEEKLEYLLNHPEKLPEMGKVGREFVERNFDITKLNKSLVNIYKSLLENGHK